MVSGDTLEKKKHAGRVINISSGIVTHNKIKSEWNTYAMSKAGVEKITHVLAEKYYPLVSFTNVRINETLDTTLAKDVKDTYKSPPEVLLPLFQWLINKPQLEITGRTYLSSDFRFYAELYHKIGNPEISYDHPSFSNDITSTSEITKMIKYSDSYNYPTKSLRLGAQYLISKKHGLKHENIVMTNGTVSALENIFDIFIGHHHNIITIIPIWHVVLNICGKRNIEVQEVNYNGEINMMDEIISKIGPHTRMIYLTSPQYAVFNSFTKGQIKNLLLKIPKNLLVVLDQCYLDYSINPLAVDGAELLKDKKIKNNLLVLRTFSKFYQKPQIRLGYIMGEPDLCSYIQSWNQNFAMNKEKLYFIMDICDKKNQAEQEKYKITLAAAKKVMYQLFDQNNIVSDTGQVGNFCHEKMKNSLDLLISNRSIISL